MINLTLPEQDYHLRPRITVIGCGGAGGNAVNNMIACNLEGAEFLVANTDAQALESTLAQRKLQLGQNITQGLGAGSRPDIGRAAAEEAFDEIRANLENSNMVFITAGMGGGTGTGSAPVIARAARDLGILTVGVVTKPFHFEGAHRMRLAEQGLEELQQYVDTLIVIPNQNLFRIANEKTTFADAFKMADEVLHSGVRGVTDLMIMPGLINLDFADIRTVMSEMGKAMMGTGEAEGERRAIQAAEAAISNPLLDDVSMKGARGILINVTGGLDMTLYEVDEATNRIRDEVDANANIIFGSTFDEDMEGKMRISVVATGIDADLQQQPRPAEMTSSFVGLAKVQPPASQPAHALDIAAQSGMQATIEATPAEQGEERVASSQADLMQNPPGSREEEHSVSEQAIASVAAVEQEEEEPLVLTPLDEKAAKNAHKTAEAVSRHFIPPQPVMPDQDSVQPPQAVAPARQAADPFAEAELTHAGQHGGDSRYQADQRRRSPNIFRRMTGMLREDQGENQDQAANPTDRTVDHKRGQGRANHEQARPQMVQPTLTGFDQPLQAKPQHQDDEALDIPAFLRRQAN